jgi:hypothetical protein
MALPEGVALPKVQVTGPGDQRFVVVASIIERALGISEARDHRLGQFLGGYEPAGLERGLVEFQQALD